MRMSWQRYIIRYSVHDQVQVIQYFRSGSRDAIQKLKNLFNWKTLINHSQKLSMAFLFVILTVVVYLVFKRRYGAFTISKRPPISVVLYQDMLRKLRKSGWVKNPSWTAGEFLQSISSMPDSKRNLITRITEFYEKHRFANCPVSPSREKEIRELIKSL